MRSGQFRREAVLAGVLWAGLGAAGAAAPPAPVEGVWSSPNGTEITITACEQGYCGYLSRIVVPPEYLERYRGLIEGLSVEQYFDFNNPDPALRSRRVLGLRIITMRPGGSPGRYVGELYNVEDGRTYAGSLELLGPDRIRVRGCVLVILCRGEEWVRVPGPETGD